MRTNAKVYLMQAEDGSLKLGHSNNPSVRAKQLGVPVLVVHETDILEQAERIERLAHRVLALNGGHIKGEWFKASVEDGIAAIEIAIRQAENVEFALGVDIDRRSGASDDRIQVNIRVCQEDLDRLEELRRAFTPIPPTTVNARRQSSRKKKQALLISAGRFLAMTIQCLSRCTQISPA